MKFEEPPKLAEIHKETETIIKSRETLKNLLKEEAERLRSFGFAVDNECRIDLATFKNVFEFEKIGKDLSYVEHTEAKFEKENPKYKESPEHIKGEVLEIGKTLAFNKYWFRRKLTAVRTSKYDDYCNGIDELILDTETGFPLAAVDDTTNYKFKIKELIEKIKTGCKIKYGLGFSKEGLEKKSYDNLPLFIISITPYELNTLAKDLIKGEMSSEGKNIEEKIRNDLKAQSNSFDSYAPQKMKNSYAQAGKIFEKL